MKRNQYKNIYLLMTNVNDFKEINNTQGHIEGGFILVVLAKEMTKDTIGEECFIARYGVDEFVIVIETNDL